MRRLLMIGFMFIGMTSCAQDRVSFPEEALNDVFVTSSGTESSFSEVLSKYKGKTILIDVWATWCKDCIVGMPKVKALQAEYEDVVFLFLSLDKNQESWKKGIEHYNLKGEHYFVSSGWKGDFGSSIKLSWIPRYMVVNPQGEISLWKAIKADDKKITSVLDAVN